ncbi:MFS transporter [Phaeodactylibacter sp.]|jgi:UMF1 family MFS transporter|uniref:MFS transporter n=1 Tax=Phaeodactylibacter sp. TaxID=1940289 RepID=UPI0025F492F3|nr:MFS transporter [Phaeodactylibacter sp.]MCI4648215.1 MFS transporter [Phaeodactylibacter sp.]MCI5091930.1 MFS transporter [Phaeodactylibacter sp.]
MASTSADFPINDKRIINGWAIFDWANSAFALVITAAIFPAYFVAVTDEDLSVFGMEMSNSSLYTFAISASYFIIALFSPLLSGIADYGGRRKFFLKFFTILGSLSCLSLFFFKGMEQLELGTVGFMLSMIGFAGGLVFYNAFLPVIVTEDLYDRVSARGFSFGYIGSVILLIINLVMVQFWERFGFPDQGTATRYAFLSVGFWWIGFALIPFRRLPSDEKQKTSPEILRKGFQELKKVWGAVKGEQNIRAFLFSFFFYSAGVQTVLFLASTFASKELNFETSELIVIILLLQIVAILGAYSFARLSEWKGNKVSLIAMLLIWIAICVIGYLVQEKAQFYAIAAAVGLVMGGIQSLSRSTYSKLIPENSDDTTSYFSFYDVLEKVAIIVGTFTFGLMEQVTGSMRLSMLVLSGFFLVGLLLLLRVRVRATARPEV